MDSHEAETGHLLT